jgi:uroporphyrinogen decarboxylase
MTMTSMQRVLTTLGHREPDRTPLFLLLTMHGAKELGLTIQNYFARADHVVEGQMRLRAKYGHDCLYAFFYAGLEVEAWGGEVVFREDGPPNAGEPIIKNPESISHLQPPSISRSPQLAKVLEAVQGLKQRVGDDAPIIGVVMSPFSLPVMQMGFEAYLDLILERPADFQRLMEVNEEFCVGWANAQLEAGATAICYFDPVSSSTVIPRELYLQTGQPVAMRTLARIKGPTATHMASGRCLPIIGDLAATGTAAVGVSRDEDLGRIKAACAGRLSVLGDLNALEMRRWSPDQAEAEVKRALAQAAPGGGFILADNHGEIPFQVEDEVLMATARAARRWGSCPLSWIGDHAA